MPQILRFFGARKLVSKFSSIYKSSTSASGVVQLQQTKELSTSSSTVSGRLDGKIAIVTASTEGIGLCIARRLLQDGAKVMISSRKNKNVDSALETLRTEGYTSVSGTTCHVAKGSDREKLISQTVEQYGGVDILVSNAATNPVMGPTLTCSEEAWDKIFEVNVKSAFLLSQAIVPLMQKRNGGSIVFISSITGLQPTPMLGAYSVSKTALLGLNKVLSQECAADNIRVNCVAPGFVNTKFSGAITGSEDLLRKITDMTPLNRIAEPHEIGGLVSFLCSDDASYITGETIVVAGGMPSRL